MDQFRAAVAIMSILESERKTRDGDDQYQAAIASILATRDDGVHHRSPLGATVAARIRAAWPHRRPRLKSRLDPAPQS